MSDLQIRPASAETDTAMFINVYELASHGLAPYLWQQNCPKDVRLSDYVFNRIKSRLETSEPGTNLTAIVDGKPVGGTMTYAIGDVPEDIPDGTDPNVVPLIELENEAPNTQYINVLAVMPEAQGRGVGQKLIEAIDPLRGVNGVSLIVEDTNPAAQRLYERLGFRVTATRKFTPVGWESNCREYRLMVKPN